MRAAAIRYAERGVGMLETALRREPPPGVPVEFVGIFFKRFGELLRGELAKLLDQFLDARVPTAVPAPVSVLPPDGVPPDEWPAAARTAANIAAIRLIASGVKVGPAERTVLLRYSGWGGLSIDAVAAQLPREWVPEVRGLIHEYYTATKVAREIARVLLPLILTLPNLDGVVRALEPSAGIGRMIHAFASPGFAALSWTAVEYSRVSAKLLAAERPDITVFEGPFERWLASHETEVTGKVGLVVSNPPYGVRGASITEDANKSYRESKAYLYFLRRCLDLLAANGIGVFLVPYGFLTGQSAALLAVRGKVLRRHHLMTAFRLPSRLFPGANLVTDLLFFRARGGELPEVLPDDMPLLRGEYFRQFPQHILGDERGISADEDDTTRKPRRGYEVDGTFTVLPSFAERSMCVTCAVTPFYLAPEQPRKKPSEKDSLPSYLQAALTLGDRVGHFLGTLARADAASVRIAVALFAELRDALLAWQAARAAELIATAKPDDTAAARNLSPYADRLLQRESKNYAELVTLLSAFEESGELAAAFRTAPVYVPSYQGSTDDVSAQADFLYRTRRRLKLDMLREFRRELGIVDLMEPLHSMLISAGWCFDGGDWMPARDYYTGSLWPRYDRARALADQGDAKSAAQASLLLAAIRPARFSDIAPEPRMPFVPLSVLRGWLEQWTDTVVPPLVRENGLLRLEEATYTNIKDVAEQRLSIALGYLNHDFTLFRPPAVKQVNPVTGEEESAEQALSRTRLEYGERARRTFHDFIAVRPELMGQIEDSYNRIFRGYVTPEYGADELTIARWRGRIVLKPHQRAGAQRLIANNGGLLGFDVGVGKTYTGIATIAALRQAGRAKRPIVVVPNTIIWKWHKEIRAALPDYRVLVVGSERYIGRSGVYTSRIDTPQERAMKWRQFQAGEFDLALVTYSVFARNRVRAESVREWILQTPALLRQIGIDARNMLAGVKEKSDSDGSKKKRKASVSAAAIESIVGEERAKELSEEERRGVAEKIALVREVEREAEKARLLKLIETLTDMAERERAIVSEAMDRWIAERIEMSEEPDPGIYWEELQCDLLVLDEAQNMKNLWPVQQREGGMPKYLGAITEGSDRAWNLAIRAALVRQRTGGSGVVLLSATPAKNSPLEYYTLLGYVDGDAWARLGITDPEVFIDRYLRLEMKDIVGSDLSTQRRSVVAGFQNLDELRSVVFRYAEFRTAEEVGLKLPETQVEQIRVPMSEAQVKKYDAYLTDYEQALKRARQDPKARLRALGLLQRMALVAIHPELDRGPLVGGGSKEQWTFANAQQVKDPGCPKLLKVRDLILQKPDCGHLVFCDNVAVHAWLVMLLVAAGFPRERIAIFNADQAPNPVRRQLLAERFNGVAPVLDEQGNIEQEGTAPQYDVVIANATAYEGIDLHVRTCQVYHLDLPWEPATLQQRNGRAVRQGNMQAVIRIIYVLSEQSMDAVRFSMILGKLNWMKDILKSADRETNNPGAQAEMNPEELLLYLARDPEQARAAIEEQKKMLQEETRQRVRRQAWTSLRGIATRAQSLVRVTDETQRAQVVREMDELRGYLAQVPSETWPWFHFADLAMTGTPMLFGPDWALYRGGAVYRDGQGFEMGEVRVESIGVRLLGDYQWHALTAEKLAAPEPGRVLQAVKELCAQATPEDFKLAQKRWPLAQDREQFDAELRRAVHSLRSGDFDVLGIDLASPSWRSWLWETHKDSILDALSAAPASMPFGIPAAVQAKLQPLALLSGSAIAARKADIIPFTYDAFSVLTDLSPSSGYKWTELNATALTWWGLPFPRGLLREADTGTLVEIRMHGVVKKVRAIWQSPHFAVTYSPDRGPDHASGPLYNVTHLASGLAAAQSFQSPEAARAAAQWMATLESNWESAKPDFTRLPANMKSVIAWIRIQTNTPSLDEIKKKAAA